MGLEGAPKSNEDKKDEGVNLGRRNFLKSMAAAGVFTTAPGVMAREFVETGDEAHAETIQELIDALAAAVNERQREASLLFSRDSAQTDAEEKEQLRLDKDSFFEEKFTDEDEKEKVPTSEQSGINTLLTRIQYVVDAVRAGTYDARTHQLIDTLVADIPLETQEDVAIFLDNVDTLATHFALNNYHLNLLGAGAPVLIPATYEITSLRDAEGLKSIFGEDTPSEIGTLFVNEKRLHTLGSDNHGPSVVNRAYIPNNAKKVGIENAIFEYCVVINETGHRILKRRFKFSPSFDRALIQTSIGDSEQKPVSNMEIHEFVSDAASISENKYFARAQIYNIVYSEAYRQVGEDTHGSYAHTLEVMRTLVRERLAMRGIADPFEDIQVEFEKRMGTEAEITPTVVSSFSKDVAPDIFALLTEEDYDAIQEMYIKRAQSYLRIIREYTPQ